MKSLDPRVARLDIERGDSDNYKTNSHWVTFEVFQQEARGKHPMHVGVVHAPGPELALVFAKEQFCRRKSTSTIWVVKTTDIYTSRREDEDMFESVPTKQFREPGAYKVRQRIEDFKKRKAQTAS